MTTTAPHQSGGAISLLLTLAALGLLIYLVLGTSSEEVSAPSSTLRCEQRISVLMSETGGIGERAQAGYEALPESCKALMPDPSSLLPDPVNIP